jgi:hypothetical protein
MNEIARQDPNIQLLPQKRFDDDFPLVFWATGLWLYLKSFLYICNLYVIGLEPQPYQLALKVEIVYFAIAFLPAFFLGLMMWNRPRAFELLAVVFLVLDTPFLIFHIINLSQANFLESGLTKLLEYTSLGLNFLILGWLMAQVARQRVKQA